MMKYPVLKIASVIIPAALLAAAAFWVSGMSEDGRPVPAEEVTEISFMGSGPVAGPLDDAIKEFERLSRLRHQEDPSYPIYKVVSGQTAARDRTQDPTRFLLSVVGGMPPDVVAFDRFALCQWVDLGAFEPLDRFIAADRFAWQAWQDGRSPREPWPGAGPRHRRARFAAPVDPVDPASFYPAAWAETVYRNQVYGVPLSIESRALLYNKDLLIRHGFVDENGEARPPRDYAELERMALAMTEVDERGRTVTMGFIPNYGNSWLYLYGWQHGATFLSADGKTVTLHERPVVEALDFVVSLYDQLGGARAVYAFQSSFQVGDLDPFLTGKVAMKIDGAWAVNNIALSGTSVRFGVAPAPMPRAGEEPVSWVSGWCYAIPSTSRNKQGAWELIRFLNSRYSALLYAESERFQFEAQGRNYLPYQLPRRDVNREISELYLNNNPRIPRQIAEGRAVFDELLEKSFYRPVTPVGQKLWQAQVDAMEEAIFHKKSSGEALAYHAGLVQRELDARLREHRRDGVKVNWFWTMSGYVALLAATVAGIALLEYRRRRRPHAAYRANRWYEGVCCILPWAIGFMLFTGGPIFFSIVISFCKYDILNEAVVSGVENYRFMFRDDELFGTALWNTAYMVIGVPLGIVAGLAMALLLNCRVRGVALWRTCFYLPSIVPAVAASLLWIWIFNPQFGLINSLLALFGVHGPNWLQDENTSKIALIIMGLWSSGGGLVIWLAGLKNINPVYYEAAQIDGAGPVRSFFAITLPMLSPYIFFNFIIGLIGVFQIFTQAFIMTQGGPVNSTLFYAYHIFNQAFRYLNMGYAAALSWILFAIVLVLTLIQLKLSRRWVYYEE